MRTLVRGPLVFVVALIALGVVAGVVRPAAGPARTPRAAALPVTEAEVVCPDSTGSSVAPTTLTVANVAGQLPQQRLTSARVREMPLTGPTAKATELASQPLSRIRSTSAGHAVSLQASGPGAFAVAADQSRLVPHGRWRALMSTPCLAPQTDWWIAGTDGRVGFADRLVIANPGSTIANVTVTAWTQKGHQEPPRLQAFTIGPDAVNVLPVSGFVPDDAWVTVHVRANSGRIVAEILDRRVSGILPTGADWIPPTQPPARDVVVPGFLGGTGARVLYLTDPGPRDATVSLHLATTGGNFAPAGHQTIVVRSGRTVATDLSGSLGGAPGAVLLRSDVPVVASGLSSAAAANAKDHPDLQWQPAGVPVSRPAVLPDNTPPFARNVRLYLTAPQGAAQLRVTPSSGASRVLRVPAGRTLAWDPVAAMGSAAAYGPLVLSPVGSAPVYAARTLLAYGLHGPLTTSEQPSLLPVAVTLPAVVPDIRAAVP